MSYKNINNPKLSITSQQILSIKYSKASQSYPQMKINLLICSRPSHYNTLYRDSLIWNNPYSICIRYYKINKSRIKIPMKAIYYKNYLLFFSRPFIWDLRLDKVIQIHINKKAKLFYKQVYGSIHKNKQEDLNGQNAINKIGALIVNRSREKDEMNDHLLKTVFDTSVRNIIDNHILTTTTTTDLLNIQDDYIIQNNEDCFTLDTYNDFFVDLVYNISKPNAMKNERKNNNFHLNSKLFLLTHSSPISNIATTTKDDERKGKHNINCNIPLKNKTGHVKSSYCNLYKSKPSSSVSKSKSKSKNKNNVDSNNKRNSNAIHYSNNNRNEGRGFQLHSPHYQINTNYSEFKKYNYSIHSKSKSKSKQNSITSKSNANEILKPQYTSYIKTSYYKNSMDKSNKSLLKNSNNPIKGHISIEEHYTKSTIVNKSKCNNNYTNAHTNSNMNNIPKAKNSPVINRNILLNYLNNVLNSRQTKQKNYHNNYFSMRNLSHEKSFPIQSTKGKTSYMPNHHNHNQIYYSNANSNKNIFNTAQNNNQYNNNSNSNSRVCLSTVKQNSTLANDYLDSQYKKISHTKNNSKDNLMIQKSASNSKTKPNTSNNNKPNAHGSTRSPTVSNCIIKGAFCRNQSHLSVFNDKERNTSLAVIEKLIKGIKKNLYTNAIINDISISKKNNKSIKSTKHNDSTQTSSNTHQGHAHSKSPQLIELGKNDSNSLMINKYKYKYKSEGILPNYNKIKAFSSQRKGL